MTRGFEIDRTVAYLLIHIIIEARLGPTLGCKCNNQPRRLAVAIVDLYAVQSTITAIAEVFLRDEMAATIDEAKARFREEPEVQQCYYVTGGTSFVLIVITTDMRSYERLTRRLFEENDHVNRFRTLVALDRVKAGTAISIP
jgi:DNA-binding Lrp family transcriptional regulator